MKKNIVLVTWLGGGNYGTSLQSFALHKKIEGLGYHVSFLLEFPKKFTLKNKIKFVLGILGVNKKLKNKILPKRQTPKQQKLSKFISTNYNLCKSINSKRQLSKLIKNTDVFVTGSDQIWNTSYNFNPFYFLDFVDNAKRIAYASSIGLQDFPNQHKPEVKKLLSKFKHIGLREETGVYAISKLLCRTDVVQVVDPTFLLDAKDWKNISQNSHIEIELPEKYIFCYLIGKNKWYEDQLKKVSQLTDIKNIIIVPATENINFTIGGATIYNSAGPLEFVKLIERSSFVCTDSFHATAIALNLNKDFVEFIRFKNTDSSSQNSRIYDILSHYQLMNRIYSDVSNEWTLPINYSTVNDILEKDRKASLDYLKNAIEN